MIQVCKSMVLPASLAVAASAAQAALGTQHNLLEATACQQPGNRLLNVPATTYNDAAVKARPIADQRGKCCYCEAYLHHVGYGDVEHYRPKNGFKQAPVDRQLGKPGYYWVAFDGDNLLSHNPASRTRSHHDPLSQEHRLLLHPAFNNSARRIEFRKAIAIGRTPEGKATIKTCGLNRPTTQEHHRAHLGRLVRDELLADLNLAALNDTEKNRLARSHGSLRAAVRRIIQARKACQATVLSTAEYAGMARDYLK